MPMESDLTAGPETRSDAVDSAIGSRRSVRAFLPDGISTADVEQILSVASRAPSGHNTQPWRVHVVSGAARARIVAAMTAAFEDPALDAEQVPEFDSYPAEWISPYIDRRRQVGRDLYGLLGIPRGDQVGMRTQIARNFELFGAPYGLLFTTERIMLPGAALDIGMFMQSVMIAARARGFDTCPQAALAKYHRVIADALPLPPGETLVCGMAIGRADPEALVNQLSTDRMSVSEFTTFHGP